MSGPTFSIRSILLAVAAIAALFSIPAYWITQIRGEADTGKRLQATAVEEARAIGEPNPNVISLSPPRRGLWRAMYRLAGSEGEITSADIIGDRSARVVSDHAGMLRSVRHLRIVKEFKEGRREYVTPAQIHAASLLRPLKELEIYASFSPDVQISALARIKKIEWLRIYAYRIPFQVIDQLSTINADRLDIVYEDTCPECLPPSEAFASFSRIPCTEITISGGIDDRAFELIAAAPNLEYLHVNYLNCLGSPNNITDEGMKLASKSLRASYLIVGCSDLTDACIEYVADIKSLQTVELIASNITPDGFKRLAELRPDMVIR